MPTSDEQKKIDKATEQSAREASNLDQQGGNAERTASGERREELVYLDAPTPDTVSNQLPEGKGYYVRGKLVDPDGDLLRR